MSKTVALEVDGGSGEMDAAVVMVDPSMAEEYEREEAKEGQMELEGEWSREFSGQIRGRCSGHGPMRVQNESGMVVPGAAAATGC